MVLVRTRVQDLTVTATQNFPDLLVPRPSNAHLIRVFMEPVPIPHWDTTVTVKKSTQGPNVTVRYRVRLNLAYTEPAQTPRLDSVVLVM